MLSAYSDVLTLPAARRLIGASAVSQLGDWLYNAALLGYIYHATHSAGWVGAATIVRLLPFVLLGPAGGMIADRHRRRRVLLAGDAARALIMGGLAVAVAAHGPVIAVLALTALASAAGSAEKPAAMAWLPRLVGESRLGAANALLHSAQDLGIVFGPLVGALLLAVASPWAAFCANAATFAVSVLLVAGISSDRAPTGAPVGAGQHLREGVRATRATPYVLALFGLVAMVELTYGAQTVQLVVYARLSLHLGSGGYGDLLAATGAGGLLGALASGRLSAHRRTSWIVVGAAVVMCVTQLVFAGSGALAVALPVAAAGGAGIVACEVICETLIVRVAPAEALGRIMGIFDALSVAAMVLGAVLAPVLIAAGSLRISLLILGAATVVVDLGCFAGLRGLDALSARRAEALAEKVRALAGLPVTKGVATLYLEQLAAVSQFCALPPGVDVVVQGAPAHAFYAVIEGSVAVHRDGRPVVWLGPGDSFGERGLLDNAPRNATVTTAEETRLLRVEGAALLDALESATNLRPALERNINAPGIRPRRESSPLVDDRTWVSA